MRFVKLGIDVGSVSVFGQDTAEFQSALCVNRRLAQSIKLSGDDEGRRLARDLFRGVDTAQRLLENLMRKRFHPDG